MAKAKALDLRAEPLGINAQLINAMRDYIFCPNWTDSIKKKKKKKIQTQQGVILYSVVTCTAQTPHAANLFRLAELDFSRTANRNWTGADTGFFLGVGAPLRNGMTNWWRKQIRRRRLLTRQWHNLNCWEYIVYHKNLHILQNTGCQEPSREGEEAHPLLLPLRSAPAEKNLSREGAVLPKEDKGNREGIPHTHPIP